MSCRRCTYTHVYNMRNCVCVCGFRAQHFCCQAYRKWVIQIGLAKWIFIETVAGHFVVVFASGAVAFCWCAKF